MLQFKIKADEETASALGLNEDTIIEGYYHNGEIVIRALDDEDEAEDTPTLCRDCPNICKTLSTCNVRHTEENHYRRITYDN